MRTKIISAFPGTGKTYFYNNNKDICIDIDSSNFSWIADADGKKVRSTEFPQNYIDRIKENIGKYEFILVSSHKVVREALFDNCLFYYLVFPYLDRKEVFIINYRNRGDDENFIKLVSNNWNCWIKECLFEDVGCRRFGLDEVWFLSNMISHIKCKEKGTLKFIDYDFCNLYL